MSRHHHIGESDTFSHPGAGENDRSTPDVDKSDKPGPFDQSPYNVDTKHHEAPMPSEVASYLRRWYLTENKDDDKVLRNRVATIEKGRELEFYKGNPPVLTREIDGTIYEYSTPVFLSDNLLIFSTKTPQEDRGPNDLLVFTINQRGAVSEAVVSKVNTLDQSGEQTTSLDLTIPVYEKGPLGRTEKIERTVRWAGIDNPTSVHMTPDLRDAQSENLPNKKTRAAILEEAQDSLGKLNPDSETKEAEDLLKTIETMVLAYRYRVPDVPEGSVAPDLLVKASGVKNNLAEVEMPKMEARKRLASVLLNVEDGKSTLRLDAMDRLLYCFIGDADREKRNKQELPLVLRSVDGINDRNYNASIGSVFTDDGKILAIRTQNPGGMSGYAQEYFVAQMDVESGELIEMVVERAHYLKETERTYLTLKHPLTGKLEYVDWHRGETGAGYDFRLREDGTPEYGSMQSIDGLLVEFKAQTGGFTVADMVRIGREADKMAREEAEKHARAFGSPAVGESIAQIAQ